MKPKAHRFLIGDNSDVASNASETIIAVAQNGHALVIHVHDLGAAGMLPQNAETRLPQAVATRLWPWSANRE